MLDATIYRPQMFFYVSVSYSIAEVRISEFVISLSSLFPETDTSTCSWNAPAPRAARRCAAHCVLSFLHRLRPFRQAVLWGRWCCGCSWWGCCSLVVVVVVVVVVARCRCCCRGLFPGKARQEPFWCVCIAFGTLGGRFRSPWGLLRVTLGRSWAGSGGPGYPWEGLGQAWGGLGASLGAPWGALGGLRGSMVLLGDLGGCLWGGKGSPNSS